MNFLSSIRKKQWKGKKIIFGLLIAFLVMNILPLFSFIISSVDEASFLVQETLAEEAEKKSDFNPQNWNDIWKKGKNGEENSVIKKISEWASVIIGVFTPLIAFVVKIVGSLMGDSYIFGNNGTGEFNILDLLYQMWDVVRTLVNYSFLLFLLFYAVMNIIPYASEEYELKKVLPKLVLGIVVVNMSFSGMIAVFDVVDVAARVVFAIPQTILKNDNNSWKFQDKCTINNIPNDEWNQKLGDGSTGGNTASDTSKQSTDKKLYIHGVCFPVYITLNPKGNFDAEPEIGTDEDLQKAKQSTFLKGKNIEKVVNYGSMTIYWGDFSWDNFNEGTIAPLFAFSVMQIQNLPRSALNSFNELKKGIADDGGDLEKRAKNVGGTASLFINIIMSLILMIVVLLVFVLMAISLFFRIILLWINIIFSPLMAIKIAFPQVLSGAEGGVSEYLGFDAFIKYAFAPVIMGIPLVIGFIIIGVGQQYKLLGMNGGILLEGAAVDGLSSIHGLFYYFLAVAVLWVGGVEAIKSVSAGFVNDKFTSKITGFVDDVMGAAGSGIMRTPFIPMGDFNQDGKPSNASLHNLFTDLPYKFKTSATQRDQAARNEWGLPGDNELSPSQKAFGSGGSLYGQNKQDIMKKLKSVNDDKLIRQSGENQETYVNRVFSSQNPSVKNIFYTMPIKDLAGLVWEAKNEGKSHKVGVTEITQLTRQMEGSSSPEKPGTKTEKSSAETPKVDNKASTSSEKINDAEKKDDVKKKKETLITKSLKNSDIKPEHLNDDADLKGLDEAALEGIKELKTLKVTPEEYQKKLEEKAAADKS